MNGNIKIEEWCGHKIRFIEVDGEWMAVAKDVSDTLGYRDANAMTRFVDDDSKGTHIVSTLGGEQEMLLVSEFGIYQSAFKSRRTEAENFRKWVYKLISELRKASGLEGFQVFRMMDKEHQKAMMTRLKSSFINATQKEYVKANTIANKAVSNIYGYPKMIEKNEMTPQMLVDRQPILEDTVALMDMQEKFGVPEHIAPLIYERHCVRG